MFFLVKLKRQPNLARNAGKIIMMGPSTVKSIRRSRSAKAWGLAFAAKRMKTRGLEGSRRREPK